MACIRSREIDLKNGTSYTKSLEYYTTAVELYRAVQASGMYDPRWMS